MSDSPKPDADARLAAIVDSSFDAIVSKDLNSIIVSWNAAAERLFGYTAEEAIGQSVLMLIPESMHGEEVDIISRIRRGERVPRFDTTRRRKNGSLISVSLTVSPIRDRNGVIVGASKIARDITAAKENERRIRFLMREVNHRVKNQFAVILSMVRETNKRSSSPREFEERIRDRIMALSRSHDLLVSSEWAGARLADLVLEHLKPFGHEDRIALSGPELSLSPNAVQHLGMAFHELGTNSAKYGALARDGGSIAVSWSIAPGDDGRPMLTLTWNETCPPRPVDERPKEEVDDGIRKGFGTVVLQRVTGQSLGGTTALSRSDSAVRWTLTAPLDGVINTPD